MDQADTPFETPVVKKTKGKKDKKEQRPEFKDQPFKRGAYAPIVQGLVSVNATENKHQVDVDLTWVPRLVERVVDATYAEYAQNVNNPLARHECEDAIKRVIHMALAKKSTAVKQDPRAVGYQAVMSAVTRLKLTIPTFLMDLVESIGEVEVEGQMFTPAYPHIVGFDQMAKATHTVGENEVPVNIPPDAMFVNMAVPAWRRDLRDFHFEKYNRWISETNVTIPLGAGVQALRISPPRLVSGAAAYLAWIGPANQGLLPADVRNTLNRLVVLEQDELNANQMQQALIASGVVAVNWPPNVVAERLSVYQRGPETRATAYLRKFFRMSEEVKNMDELGTPWYLGKAMGVRATAHPFKMDKDQLAYAVMLRVNARYVLNPRQMESTCGSDPDQVMYEFIKKNAVTGTL